MKINSGIGCVILLAVSALVAGLFFFLFRSAQEGTMGPHESVVCFGFLWVCAFLIIGFMISDTGVERGSTTDLSPYNRKGHSIASDVRLTEDPYEGYQGSVGPYDQDNHE